MDAQQQHYWQNFYSDFNVKNPSGFALFVNKYLGTKDNKRCYNILDVGCGNGRDTYYFASCHGRYIATGIDVSVKPTAHTHCEFFVSDMVTFDKSPFDVIYSRFTFHSITNEQHEQLLSSITRPGTFLCIETRSSKDTTPHVHGDTHYRNLIESDYLVTLLQKHHFTILYMNESNGLAKYHDEDPVCIRVICQKQ
jgi:tellurite methyltransferase